MPSLTESSASLLAVLIGAREVNAVEVVDAYLARIDALNPGPLRRPSKPTWVAGSRR